MTVARRRAPRHRAEALAGAGLAEATMARLGTAVAHLEQSVVAAEAAGQAPEAARAQQGLAFVKFLALGRSALEALQASTAVARAGSDIALAVDAQADLGRAYLLLGEATRAEEQFGESLVGARAGRDQGGAAQALVGLGRARVVLGRYHQADACLNEGLELARRRGELHATGIALVGLGESARLRGRAADAEESFLQAAEVAKAGDHPYPAGLALVGLGRLAFDAGQHEKARARFEEAVGKARAGPLAFLLTPCLCGLAELAQGCDDTERLLGEALGAAQRWGDWAGEAAAFEQLARLSSAQGDRRRSTTRHGQALVLRARVGDPAAIAVSLEALAGLAATRDDPIGAARLLGAAESRRDHHGCVRPRSQLQEHASVREAVRQALGTTVFDAEWRRGAALSTRAAMLYATSEARHVPRATNADPPSSGV